MWSDADPVQLPWKRVRRSFVVTCRVNLEWKSQNLRCERTREQRKTRVAVEPNTEAIQESVRLSLNSVLCLERAVGGVVWDFLCSSRWSLNMRGRPHWSELQILMHLIVVRGYWIEAREPGRTAGSAAMSILEPGLCCARFAALSGHRPGAGRVDSERRPHRCCFPTLLGEKNKRIGSNSASVQNGFSLSVASQLLTMRVSLKLARRWNLQRLGNVRTENFGLSFLTRVLVRHK